MVACSGVGSPAAPRPVAATVIPEPSTVVWDDVPGIYAKIEHWQFTTSKATHFPPAYNVDASPLVNTDSVYYELQKYTWFRGLQLPLRWNDIETSEGVFDFSFLNQIFDKVEAISLKTGITKRILLAPIGKAFSVAEASTIVLPDDMTTDGTAGSADHRGTPYSNSTSGPLYTGTPPNHTYIDVPRYDYLWGYQSTYNQPDVSSFGYHFNWAHFEDGLDGDMSPRNASESIYVLRDRFYAFMTAVHNEFKNRSALAGYIMLEPPPLQPHTASEYSQNPHFNGRLAFLKWLRALVKNHMVVEAPNHNNYWMGLMTAQGATDGCVVNHLGFTGPNMHTGQNLHGLYNARKYIAGQTPVVVQCQPQDMKSMSGSVTKANTTASPAPNDYWRWDKFPPDYGGVTTAGATQGDPNTYLEGIDGPITDGDWVIIRTRYLGGNLLSYQRNIDPTGNPFDWNDFIHYMEVTSTLISENTGGLVKNDPNGGLIATQPTWVV